MNVNFSKDVTLKAPGIKIGYAVVEGVSVSQAPKELVGELRAACQVALTRLGAKGLEGDELVKAYRRLWWAFKVDPTKLRPSPEALMRRVLRGREIPSINNAVDSANMASILTGLSVGIHDLEKISGDTITIRTARAGEVFRAIGSKGEVPLRGGELVVSDAEKIIDLMYSTSSSEDSKVDPTTRSVLYAMYAPPEVALSYLEEGLEEGLAILLKYCRGALVEKRALMA